MRGCVSITGNPPVGAGWINPPVGVPLPAVPAVPKSLGCTLTLLVMNCTCRRFSVSDAIGEVPLGGSGGETTGSVVPPPAVPPSGSG